MNNRGKKILVLGIILLFIAVVFIPCSQSVPKQLQKNSAINDDPTNKSLENGKITCYIFGKTRNNKHDFTISSAQAIQIFERLQDLKTEMSSHPYSAKTESLKTSFVNLLDEQSFFQETISKETVRSLLTPNWIQRLHDSQQQSSSPQPLLNRGTTMLCSIGSEGAGLLFPLLLFPRPRIAMFWLGDGVTFAANLLTGRGYAAGGMQVGFTLGFMGIGLSFALPGATLYGFIGYALLAHTTAEYIEHYPQNSPPEISAVQPMNGQENVPLTLNELQFRIEDAEDNLMSFSVTTSPPIGDGSGILKPNGVYSIPIEGLESSTVYSWRVEASDGQETTTKEFTFTTVMLAPFVSNPLPKHNAQYIPIWRSNVSFNLTDYQGDLMNWTVETQPDIGGGAENGVGNGRYTIAINGLEYNTKYTWFVNATDGTYWTRKTYVFTTIPEGLMVLEPSADTFVGEHTPNVNYGIDSHLLVSDKYGATSNYDARGMVIFNLSEIPSGSTIISANLSLYYYRYDDTNPVGREITCHRILEYWDEMTVTYTTMPNANPVESASTTLPASFTWVNWDVTSEVNDFINDGDENYGWMIRDYKAPWGSVNIPQQYYYSSNAADFHPRLFIWFDIP